MWRCRNNILSSVNSRLRCLSSPVNDDAWDLETLDDDDDYYVGDDDYYVGDGDYYVGDGDYYVGDDDYYVGDDVNDDAWDVDSLDDEDVLSWLSNVQGE